MVCLERGYTSLTAVSELPLLEPGVMDVITQHIDAARARRVGGILVGRRRNASVAVEAAIPAARVQEHQGEIVFLPEVWEHAYDTMLERYPGSRIVGWYHSHPGTGPGLSDYDRRLHAILFSEAPSVALVVDPLSRRAAWYGWVLGSIAPMEDAEAPVVQRTKRSRAAMVAALVVAVAAAGSAGYWAGRERAPVRVAPTSAELRAKLGAEQDRARQLGERLADAQTALTRLAAREAVQRAELEASRQRLREAARAARPRALVLRYHVQAGDSLWSMAERFYGTGLAWKRIFRANAERLSDPKLLPIGMTVRIPLS